MFNDEEFPEIIEDVRETIEEVNTEYDKDYNVLSKIFNTSRLFWAEEIQNLSKKFRRIEEITDLQVELFSNRQIILEQRHKLLETLSKLNSKLNKSKKTKILEYHTKFEVRLKDKDRDVFIDSDLSSAIQIVLLIENHCSFLEQTIKSLDSMIYGVKYRINIAEMTNK